ncbi:glucose 1-dehydrogenase [Chryseolinea sp. H1M3-3]|uniref:SDR family NAD(P)-dependent oxidoreductase n=1 Tax=Chryseolinea sp. H1M3-3 TaxID=3034144 RepID=UPI0023EB5D04|nr:glucose 1-dehydrogenase [Chryseolinea sp. H1M3-3]
MFNLDRKIAAITGGGSGIGKAIAEVFADQGAEIHILELNATTGEETVNKITSKGGKAKSYSCNVADQAQVKNVLAAIVQHAGRLDILVNCAGISHIGRLENTSEQDFDRIFTVNVKGVYNAMAGVVDQMKKQGGGVILNLASIAGSMGIADRFAYSMSKGAILSMTYSVAQDYMKDNIRCNCISPARIHTAFVDGFLSKNYPGREKEMFEKLSNAQPIGRMGKPDEVAALALYLCSDEASFVTGTDYPIDGGYIKLR